MQAVTTNGPHRVSRWRSALPFFGPAFVASIAYVDPGNFATNFTSGASFGTTLLWVVVAANLMAMLIQTLAGKVGLATGRNLAELCRDTFPRPVSRALWVQAEVVAMATDIAEVVGGAIALNLLFGMPYPLGALATGVVAFALLSVQSRGFRPFERVIVGLLLVIIVGILYALVRTGVDGGSLARGLVPAFAGTDSVLLACGIVGATVMPHVIYLHSALTQARVSDSTPSLRLRLMRHHRVDVVVAMTIAGIVNAAMLIIGARVFLGYDLSGDDALSQVFEGLRTGYGESVALAFAFALLASGFASSGVGTYAGQVIMAGFINRQIPLLLRRSVTLMPAIVIVSLVNSPTQILVISQVVLSFGIPFALIPLILLTRRRDLMGELVNTRLITSVASGVAALIIALNVFLIVRFFAAG